MSSYIFNAWGMSEDDDATIELFHDLHDRVGRTTVIHYRFIYMTYWTSKPVYDAADRDRACHAASLRFIRESIFGKKKPGIECPACALDVG